MRFLPDESVPLRLADMLAVQNHDVAAIGREHPNALADRDVLAIAYHEQRTLITSDTDFRSSIFLNKLPHAGVILFRLGYVPLAVLMDRLSFVFTHYSRQLDQFLVVTLTGCASARLNPDDRKSSPPHAPCSVSVHLYLLGTIYAFARPGSIRVLMAMRFQPLIATMASVSSARSAPRSARGPPGRPHRARPVQR